MRKIFMQRVWTLPGRNFLWNGLPWTWQTPTSTTLRCTPAGRTVNFTLAMFASDGSVPPNSDRVATLRSPSVTSTTRLSVSQTGYGCPFHWCIRHLVYLAYVDHPFRSSRNGNTWHLLWQHSCSLYCWLLKKLREWRWLIGFFIACSVAAKQWLLPTEHTYLHQCEFG